jgi:hypothetical protein
MIPIHPPYIAYVALVVVGSVLPNPSTCTKACSFEDIAKLVYF